MYTRGVFLISLFLTQIVHANTRSIFSGMASPGLCSGSVVKLKTDSKHAYLLSNGHCWEAFEEEALSTANHQLVHKNIKLSGGLAKGWVYDNSKIQHEIKLTELTFATMNKTDISLYKIEASVEELEKLSINIYELSPYDASPGEPVHITSNYWNVTQDCTVTYTIPMLRENIWTWYSSFALSANCRVKGGWSGTPVVSRVSNKIIGVVNTVNDDGSMCGDNTPCEIYSFDDVKVNKDITYAQRTQEILTCVDESGLFDLNQPHCKL